MIATLFKSIADRLESEMPELKDIQLFSGQYENPEENMPINPPAVYVEFGDIDWSNLGNGSQQGNFTLRLHFVSQHMMPAYSKNKPGLLNDYDVNVLQQTEKLHRALHRWAPLDTEGNPISQPLMRSRTIPDNRPDALHIWITEFVSMGIDNSANPYNNMTSVEVSADIDVQ